MRFGGLRTRLTLMLAGLVVIALVLAFAVAYQGTSSRLGTRTDADLRADMVSLQAALAGAGTVDEVLERAQTYVASAPFAASARVIYVSADGAPAVTNQPELLEHGHGRNDHGSGKAFGHAGIDAFDDQAVGFGSSDTASAGAVRVLIADQTVAGTSVRLVVGESLAANTRATSVVRDAFLLAGLAALFAAIAAGFLVADRIARPLRRMAAVAASVDGGDLGRRMGDTRRDDEVGALARSFDTMLDRLQEAFARQSAFVADASHELRTPLTVVRGQLELLAMEQAPDAMRVREVERVTSIEIDRMSRLVDDLLVLAHAGEESFLQIEPLDLPAFLAGVFDPLRQTAARRYVLGTVPHLVVEADPDRLAQALRNLIRNAVAHTAEGGLVRLAAERTGVQLLLIVDDDGPGVPAEARDGIFDRFRRLGTARTAGGGAGLGLSITRAIVEAHGGRVTVASSPEAGARFTIALRLREENS